MNLAHRTTLIFILLGLLIPSFSFSQENTTSNKPRFWEVQSVDTMKYSRDVAREKLKDKKFDNVIETQVAAIAKSGTTHIAIATPYDEEFLPFMKRWVDAARRHNLNVWFRGNWSGWEGWFEYSKISRDQHISKTEEFIYRNRNLFADGDIFTACPECENGGPGDPRLNGDVSGHRKFLIDEYKITKKAFEKIDKKVISNYNSMNGDVANLVMNKETTKALDGVIAIDHYVKTKERLAEDIRRLAKEREAKIVLAEFGAPIPDIHGRLNEKDQAKWIYEALNEISKIDALVGVNYWVGFGGSTSLWMDNGYSKLGATVLSTSYTPPVVTGFLKDKLDRPISDAKVKNEYGEIKTDDKGKFELPYMENSGRVVYLYAHGFFDKVVEIKPESDGQLITLDRSHPSFGFRFLLTVKYLANLFHSIYQ